MIKQRNLLHETENIGNTLAKSRREFSRLTYGAQVLKCDRISQFISNKIITLSQRRSLKQSNLNHTMKSRSLRRSLNPGGVSTPSTAPKQRTRSPTVISVQVLHTSRSRVTPEAVWVRQEPSSEKSSTERKLPQFRKETLKHLQLKKSFKTTSPNLKPSIHKTTSISKQHQLKQSPIKK